MNGLLLRSNKKVLSRTWGKVCLISFHIRCVEIVAADVSKGLRTSMLFLLGDKPRRALVSLNEDNHQILKFGYFFSRLNFLSDSSWEFYNLDAKDLESVLKNHELLESLRGNLSLFSIFFSC